MEQLQYQRAPSVGKFIRPVRKILLSNYLLGTRVPLAISVVDPEPFGFPGSGSLLGKLIRIQEHGN